MKDRQLIFNYPEKLFTNANVMAVKNADFSDIELLALVIRGEIVSTFSHPELLKLERHVIGDETDDKLLQYSGIPLGVACTLVCVSTFKKIRNVFGEVYTLTAKTPNKESMAIENFTARTILQLASQLLVMIAINEGYDSGIQPNLCQQTELRVKH
ncbi:hypothetical protein DAPPUDRAFT_322181 [Daphnia pulex]|uniref:Uncharacterized protein n=1 Tax=Daphnia pulex TaxID=6669 RepID=E9GV05_DAPPU|nr:hypothetical protein DAPPUDRAFT_322181 [Daphnia pulex]|eukprot:EFX76699.1 hypothetical protein DAPPUDRAFT_322181 [Daphnia pulex]